MAAQEMPEKYRLLITLAVILLINGGIWGYFYTLNKQYKALDKNRASLNKQVDKLEARAAQKKDKKLKLEKLRNKNKRQLKKIPDSVRPDKFMMELLELAAKFKVSVPSGVLRPILNKATGIPGLGPSFKKDTYVTNYRADFKSFCGFANHLEEHHRWFVGLEKVTITAASNGMTRTGTQHNIKFDVVTYRYTAKR